MSATYPINARKSLRTRPATGWCAVKALGVVVAGAAFWAATISILLKL